MVISYWPIDLVLVMNKNMSILKENHHRNNHKRSSCEIDIEESQKSEFTSRYDFMAASLVTKRSRTVLTQQQQLFSAGCIFGRGTLLSGSYKTPQDCQLPLHLTHSLKNKFNAFNIQQFSRVQKTSVLSQRHQHNNKKLKTEIEKL